MSTELIIKLVVIVNHSEAQLTLDYYASTCLTVFDIVRKEMECSVPFDPRNAASIVRFHFHDCFIQVSTLPIFF